MPNSATEPWSFIQELSSLDRARFKKQKKVILFYFYLDYGIS
jgi:hypothetical protein